MIEKLQELKNLMNDEDILANLFLNYSSYENNDIVFILKKEISKKMNIDMKNIRLIGSGHTGFSVNREKQKIESKDKIRDYDFVIIDKGFFDRITDEIEQKNLYLQGDATKYLVFKNQKIKTNREMFQQNFSKGKLHLMYVKKELFIVKICEQLERFIKEKFQMSLKISCCVYETETDFLNNQNYYYKRFLE